MIKESKWNQFGFPRDITDIQGITIHETGNTQMNAQELYDWFDNESKSNQACHYICDDIQTIQVMPDSYAVYHTSKTEDWPCHYTIAIEIVSSLNDEKYNSAVNNAITLIKSLQLMYQISSGKIFFHNDFNSKTYCPKTLIDQYGSSRAFVYERIGE